MFIKLSNRYDDRKLFREPASLANSMQVVSAKRGNPPLVVITKKNCLQIFAASMRVISAMTRNLPLHVTTTKLE